MATAPTFRASGVLSRKRHSAFSPLDLYANLPGASGPLPTINKLLTSSLSAATWGGRRRVSTLFTPHIKDPVTGIDSILEHRLAKVLPSTVVKDVGHLKWLAPRVLEPTTAGPVLHLLEDVQKGLRKMDRGRPKTKALPFSTRALRGFLAQVPAKIQVMALLAFRTASRVGDLRALRRRDLTITKDGLLVSFQVTKTNQEGEIRADHRILIPDPPAEVLSFLKARSTPEAHLFVKADVKRLETALRQYKPSPFELANWTAMDPQNSINDHYTLHSFKRGAAALAWEAAAEGRLPLADLMLFLKHKEVQSALEYCPCPMLAAKVAGSSAAAITAISRTPSSSRQ